MLSVFSCRVGCFVQFERESNWYTQQTGNCSYPIMWFCISLCVYVCMCVCMIVCMYVLCMHICMQAFVFKNQEPKKKNIQGYSNLWTQIKFENVVAFEYQSQNH